MFRFSCSHRRFSRGKELVIVNLFMALGLAAYETIFSIYLDGFGLTRSVIGFTSAFIVLLTICSSFIATPILEEFNQNKLLMWILGLTVFGFILAGMINTFWLFFVIISILSVLDIFRRDCFDIIFRDNVKDKDLNSLEGLLYTLMNMGFLLGPLAAGLFIVQFGIVSVFYLIALFYFSSLLIFISLHIKEIIKTRTKIDKDVFSNLCCYLKKKELRMPYIILTGIEIWWSLIYIYIPLFILKAGLGKVEVSLFVGFVVIPMILTEYKVGVLSEKKGFKRFFVFGFLMLSIISFALFFCENIYWKMGLLIFASFFTSCLEPLQDTFMFRRINKCDEEKFFPIYRTAAFSGSFIGRVVFAVVLLYLPENFVYLSMALIMLSFGISSLSIKEALCK